MRKVIDVTWRKNMQFEANIDNHKIILDTVKDNNGDDEGPTPKPLMLVSLGGCTGMDIVSLLKKMRVSFDSLNVKVEGDLTEEHPKHFYQIKIIYEIKGNNIDKDKVLKAINMSIDKYCGVSAVYKKAMNIEYELKIL